jgi:hypothetical protein
MRRGDERTRRGRVITGAHLMKTGQGPGVGFSSLPGGMDAGLTMVASTQRQARPKTPSTLADYAAEFF